MDTRKVGILGAGQLGRMMVEAAHRLNISTVLLDTSPLAPAKQLNALESHVQGSFSDPQSIIQLASKCDIITAEIEHVDTKVLERIEKGLIAELEESFIEIQPSWKTIRIIQDKFMQKKWLSEQGIAVTEAVDLAEASTVEDLYAVGEIFGYPYMLKSRTLAYDGRGNYVVMTKKDAPYFLEVLGAKNLYAERWASFRMELACMVVIAKNGKVYSYPVVETIHEESILKVCYVPARGISERIKENARNLAEKAVSSFEGKGVYGVEMFLLEDDTILINEIAPRPHNSGHYTIDACPTSQFEIHLRAILDLPIPLHATALSTLSTKAIMINVIGTKDGDPWGHLKLARKALEVRGATVHLYGKGEGRAGRKMGHVTIVGDRMEELEENAAELISMARSLSSSSSPIQINKGKLFPKHSYQEPSIQQKSPLVSIIMGSDSDLPTMRPAAQILQIFDIPFELTIVSAHRTPTRMAHFAENARKRGIRVVIAGAGGAAHLPGMVASECTLPVIGVPVKASVLDGVDSLYSIVQMPRGIPVATVGIGNSTNAGLLAARILGCETEGDVLAKEIWKKLEDYKMNLEQEVLVKVEKIERVDENGEMGWVRWGLK